MVSASQKFFEYLLSTFLRELNISKNQNLILFILFLLIIYKFFIFVLIIIKFSCFIYVFSKLIFEINIYIYFKKQYTLLCILLLY